MITNMGLFFLVFDGSFAAWDFTHPGVFFLAMGAFMCAIFGAQATLVVAANRGWF